MTQRRLARTHCSATSLEGIYWHAYCISLGRTPLGWDANNSKVSPSIIGEVTLPILPTNDALFGGNKGPAVDDPVVANNLGNHGNVALVPEPSTWAMILLGAGVLVATMRFRQRRA